MNWMEWRFALIGELAHTFGTTIPESEKYVEQTGNGCWRESFDDGLTPADAALEELNAAGESL